jgi:hypothetical protein
VTRTTSQPDPALLSAAWGALWGAALGLPFLAPKIISAHHIRPDGPMQWAVLVAGLLALFALTGAYLSFLGGFVLAIVEKAVWGTFRRRNWAYALLSGALVVVAYTIESFLIHWLSYGSFDLLEHLGEFVLIVSFCAGVCAACAGAYRLIAARSDPKPTRVLVSVLGGVLVAGILVVVLSGQRASARPTGAGALEPDATTAPGVPLLVIGLDGGTWRVLDRAIQDGTAPTLADLVRRGTTGTVEALWPPHWSGAAWASILTGLPREVTGVYEDLAATAPGLPIMQVPITRDLFLNPVFVMRAGLVAADLVRFSPPPRALLPAKPVWQLLHEAGVDAAVVRFRFTYPPQGQANVVVSDWAGRDQWESLGVRRDVGADAVTPANRADELLAPFRSEGPSDTRLFESLLPGPEPAKPADALLDPIHELRLASDIDDRTFRVSESILKANPNQEFLAVYIGGVDSVEHAFWPYRFPGEFPINPPARRDVERLGPVLDRYVQYFDRRVKGLIDLYGAPPNVLIVSDHGQGASTSATSWRGWHTKDGMFIAAGPSVPHRSERIAVSYYDILPTIVGLKGFRPPAALQGRSVLGQDSGQ